MRCSREVPAAVQTCLLIQFVTSPAGEDKMSVDEVSRLIEVWVNEVGNTGEGEEDEESMQILQEAWDDVDGGELPMGEVRP